MGKVSIGLRGWRFDEADVFDDDGDFLPVDEMPKGPRERLLRLSALVGEPCDACWLVHGDEEIEACNPAGAVYGEPLAEVLVCREHEADLLYWFREADGARHRGSDTFRDAFHAWFADGGRAPDGYAGVEHVDTDPAAVPQPVPEPDAEMGDEPVGRRIDLRDPDGHGGSGA